MVPRLKVTLITGRTIDQGVGKERGKSSKEYFESASICFMNEQDMKKLGIKSKTNILVSTQYGSVVVKSLEYGSGLSSGLIFIPCGVWANVICGDKTDGTGMPYFKNIPAEVEPTKDQPVLKLEELLRKEYGR